MVTAFPPPSPSQESGACASGHAQSREERAGYVPRRIFSSAALAMKAERDNPHPAVRPPQRGIRDIDHGRSGTRQPIGTTSTTAASTKVSKPISQAFVCVSIARTPGRNANRPLSVPSGRTPKGFQALCRVASPCVALRGSRLVFAWALAGARNRLARSENRLTHPTPANQAAGLTYPPTTPSPRQSPQTPHPRASYGPSSAPRLRGGRPHRAGRTGQGATGKRRTLEGTISGTSMPFLTA